VNLTRNLQYNESTLIYVFTLSNLKSLGEITKQNIY